MYLHSYIQSHPNHDTSYSVSYTSYWKCGRLAEGVRDGQV